MEQSNKTQMTIKRLLELQSFSTDKVYTRLSSHIEPEVKVSDKKVKTVQTVHPVQTKKINVFRPTQSDDMFWCFYMMRYGEEEYFYHRQSLFAESGRRKTELTGELRDNKTLLKPYKIKLVDIEGELVTPHITRRAFIGLCAISSLPVVLIHGRTFIRIGGDSSNKWNVVMNDKQGWYLEQDVPGHEADILCKDLYEVRDMEKPIKSCSGYTIAQLKDIALKLGIATGDKKVTKLDLYQEILSKL
jgi:hypothetical protein